MAGASTATRRTGVRSLLDTNILVYADAHDEPLKQRRAIELITALRGAGLAVLSTQVLQEYVNVALRKLRMPPELIRERIAFYRRFEMVTASADLVVGALDLHAIHSLSFYDALVVQAAIVGGCERLVSEDMQHGALVGGVRIENPFIAT
jgi:predicted nucleic acid-binding protein